MSIELIVLTSLLGKFGSGAMRTLVKELVNGSDFKAPISEKMNSSRQLERPENRMSLGKRLIDGKEMLAVCLEKEEGPAYNQAIALRDRSPKEVVVEVVGQAQSVWPQEANIDTGKTSWTLRPGSSVGHVDGWAGSIGAFVTFEYPDGPKTKKGTFNGFTSAAHVLGLNNRAQLNDHVMSPARPDSDNDASLRVGKLGPYKPLTHYTEQNEPDAVVNKADIGVVELDVDISCQLKNLVVNPNNTKDLMPISGVLSEDDLIVHLNEPVYMMGRTSRFSEGTLQVAGLGFYPIRLPNGRSYLYGDIHVVKPRDGNINFSAGGDSGALIYTANGKAAGFLVAGSPTRSFFQPAHSCLKSINAKLILG